MSQIVSSVKELYNLENGNRFIQSVPGEIEFRNSSISFLGNNNLIVFSGKIVLERCDLKFRGDNSIIFLNESRGTIKISGSIFNNSILYVGKGTQINGVMKISVGEQKNIFIGDSCLISYDVNMMTSDPHLIYSTENQRRINQSQSIYIGDHVWIGMEVLILKGTKISSGSILGGRSVVSNKKIGSNQIYGGNPAVCIKEGVMWEFESALSFNSQKTIEREWSNNRKWSFSYDENVFIPFERMEYELNSGALNDKLSFLKNLSKEKNRFSF